MMQGNGCEEIGEREGQVALASAVLLVTKQLGAEQPSPGGVRGAPAARMEKQTSGKDDENERSPPVCTIPMNEATGSFHSPPNHPGRSNPRIRVPRVAASPCGKQEAKGWSGALCATRSCHANLQPFPRIKYPEGGGKKGGAAGAWKVMSTNRCWKQMLGRSSHTYRIILGAENSSVRNAGVPLFSKPQAADAFIAGVSRQRARRASPRPLAEAGRDGGKEASLTCGGREGGAGAEKG
nr:uncharacterized protein LOC115497630 isoform X1 [Taeniopygia guttata]